MVSLAASAPTAEAPPVDSDQYFNALGFFDGQANVAPCNPAQARLVGLALGSPLFSPGVAWVDYFGIPIAVSAPFRLQLVPSGRSPSYLASISWPVPSSSELPRGQYTLHVLLQGNSELFISFPWLPFDFTTLAVTATIDPGLNSDCSPIAASTTASTTRKPSRRVLARRVQAMRRDTDKWFDRSLGTRAKYPMGRFCGRTICVQRRAGAAWKPITGR